ncbi:flagellar export chaperone FliS [Paenibacillus sp. JNUCC32]|uniref:flagellar export chaperone FliS n=1 Tax=Paenibacillus sp. JNUCC32 TaxID=2777984 RepID=UPI001E3EE24A|nr:flagellar export chaperone FliS [Paenibacillus sp. JNUCC-32]
MMKQNYQLHYQKVRVETAGPGELTLILYEELYKSLNLARSQFENGDIEQCRHNIYRSRDILQELLVTLNMDYDISKQLYQLYDYYLRRLSDFIVKKDIEILNDVIDFAKGMVETWRQALQIVKSGNE